MNRSRNKGVTLLEVLLVLAIASSILIMLINYSTQKSSQMLRDKTIVQMQQILDAGLAYYNNNGQWPIPTDSADNCTATSPKYCRIMLDTSTLVTQKYLPASPSFLVNLAAGSGCDRHFYIDYNMATGVFGVWAAFCGAGASSVANVVAGGIPSGFVTNANPLSVPTPVVCAPSDSTCYTIGQVNMPGQNLNNARSVNFANLYKSGQCVPYPACPPNMTPQIFAAPVGVSGSNDSVTSGSNPTTYPLLSYTAYATESTTAADPPNCQNQATTTVNATCVNSVATPRPVSGGANNKYWRVCLDVTTTRGTVTPLTQADAKNVGTILVVTRCQPGSGSTVEPTGSPGFDVWN